MVPDKIFDDKLRTDFAFAKHLDDIYNFIDRSAKTEYGAIRDMINQWFAGYPTGEKLELKARFAETFHSAFFELFIFHLFTNLGFTLTVHPAIQHTAKTPDFLAEGFGISFYIEAKESNDKSEAEQAHEKQLSALYDAISKLSLPNFWLSIEKLSIKGKKQPSGKRLIDAIKRKIEKLTLENISSADKKYNFDSHELMSDSGGKSLAFRRRL